jgi:hypothetical protein
MRKLAILRSNKSNSCPFGLNIPSDCCKVGNSIDSLDKDPDNFNDNISFVNSIIDNKPCKYYNGKLNDYVNCNYEDLNSKMPHSSPLFDRPFAGIQMEGVNTFPHGYYNDNSIDRSYQYGMYSIESLSFENELNLIKAAAESGILTSYVQNKLKAGKDENKFVPLTNVGSAGVFMNKNAVGNDGGVNIIINFRGVSGDPKLVSKNFGGANAVVVTLEASGPKEKNKGSALLQQQFGDVNKLNEIVSSIISHLQKQFPDKKVHKKSLVVSGFSGGGSVVANMVANRDKIPGGIDGVVINDGLHVDVNDPRMKAIVDYAKEAQKDKNKKFKIIHTAIKPSYTSTTQTADYIINQLGLQRQPIKDQKEFEQYGFAPKSEVKDGGLEIIQMYGGEDAKTPYYVDNRPGSLGDQHIQSLWKGNPYLFRDIFQE